MDNKYITKHSFQFSIPEDLQYTVNGMLIVFGRKI